MGAAAAAVIIAKEKQIVDAFRRARAVEPQRAVAPATIGVSEHLAFRKLRQHAVLREAHHGVFYLDEASWEALRSLRRRLAVVLLLIAVLAALGVWLGARNTGAV